MPKVSVILPAYNGEKFITAAIDSVLGQTYKDYEVIVVNDGSNDRTAEILSGYGGKIKVITQENGGIAKARNVAIDCSEGEYLAFLDQDDTWMPEKLECQVPLLEQDKDLGLVYTDAYIMCDNGAELLSFDLRKPYRGMAVEQLFLNNFIATSSVIVKRKYFERVGPFIQSLSPCLDYDRWLSIAALYKIDYVSKPLIRFRDHVSTFRKNEIITTKKIVATLQGFIDNHPDVSKALGKKAGRKIAYYKIDLAKKHLIRGDFQDAFTGFGEALKTDPSADTFFRIIFALLLEPAIQLLRSIKSILIKRKSPVAARG